MILLFKTELYLPETMLRPNWNAAETCDYSEKLSKLIIWKLLRTSHQIELSKFANFLFFTFCISFATTFLS